MSLPQHSNKIKNKSDADYEDYGIKDDKNRNYFEIWWLQRYKQLVAFKQVHGHCNVPQSYKPNKQLAHWVMKQRMEYKLMMQGKNSCMTQDHVRQLNHIDFQWSK